MRINSSRLCLHHCPRSGLESTYYTPPIVALPCMSSFWYVCKLFSIASWVCGHTELAQVEFRLEIHKQNPTNACSTILISPISSYWWLILLLECIFVIHIVQSIRRSGGFAAWCSRIFGASQQMPISGRCTWPTEARIVIFVPWTGFVPVSASLKPPWDNSGNQVSYLKQNSRTSAAEFHLVMQVIWVPFEPDVRAW